MTALVMISDHSEIRSLWGTLVVLIVGLALLAFIVRRQSVRQAMDDRRAAMERHPATRAAAIEQRNATAREQHRAARTVLINDTAFVEAQGRHGVAYVEAYANGRVSTWTDNPIPYLPTDREDQS